MKERIMRHTSPRQHGDLPPITLRIADACRITGIGRSKFYELIKTGEIGVLKVGAMTLVPMSGIQALLARSRSGNAEPTEHNLSDAMPPYTANAVLTVSIAGTPEQIRLGLSSTDHEKRTKAEHSIVKRLIAALYEPGDDAMKTG